MGTTKSQDERYCVKMAEQLGWTVDRSTASHNGYRFTKKNTHIWKIRDGFQVADLVDGNFTNHRPQSCLKNALTTKGVGMAYYVIEKLVCTKEPDQNNKLNSGEYQWKLFSDFQFHDYASAVSYDNDSVTPKPGANRRVALLEESGELICAWSGRQG